MVLYALEPRGADVAQRGNVAAPRKPTQTHVGATWAPTWRDGSIRLSVFGSTGIVGPIVKRTGAYTKA